MTGGSSKKHLWQHGPAGAQELFASSQPLRAESLKAFLLVEAGDREEAEQLVGGIKRALPKDGTGFLWLSYALPLVAVCSPLGDPDGAHWKQALETYRGGVFVWFAVDIELGRAAALARSWDEAEEHFLRAERTCETAGLPCFLGQAHAAQPAR